MARTEAPRPVGVVGLGHTGLPLAVWWAECEGPAVVGYDHDPAVVERLGRGQVGPEPELSERLLAVLASGRLRLTTTVPDGLEVVTLCVPTPLTVDREADLTSLWAALATVASHTHTGALWLVSSTVPVGTTEAVAQWIRHRDPQARVAMCPERVLPGHAMHEIVHLPRVVGGVDAPSTEAARAWFAARSEGPVLPTTASLAELTKLVENASRDAELAVTHAAAEIAREHGLDPFVLRDLVNAHPRARMWSPGIGIGGHCLPVDPWFLVGEGSSAGDLFRAVRDYAEGIPDRWVAHVLAQRPPPARVAVLGLAYKADTDDVRNSPAVALARGLCRHYDVRVTDPWVVVPDDLQAVDLDEALRADVVVLAVPHATYRDVRPHQGHGQLVVDACGGWRHEPRVSKGDG